MSAQQKTDQRFWWLLGAVAVASLAWLAVTAGLIGSAMDAQERQAILQTVGDRLVLILLTWSAGMAIIGWGLKRWFDVWVTPSVQLAEEAQILLNTDVVRALPAKGNAETKVLVSLFNQLVLQREALRQQMDAQVAEAAQGVEQERARLSALVAELVQSVVVCNLDGRVLLYNNRARMQFRALSPTPRVGGNAGLLGLGRSIYSVFDRKLVQHALENIEQRLQRGASQPSAQFITTTPSGQLLRVQMAPVRSVQTHDSAPAALTGFVLMLENITRDFEAQTAHDQMLHTLTVGTRAALTHMQTAIDMLDTPELEPAMRKRWMAVVRDEAHAMSQRMASVEAGVTGGLKNRWPLEDMLGTDLVGTALRRIESMTSLRATALEVDESLWLRVESFSLLQVLVYLAGRLAGEFEVRAVELRLGRSNHGPGKAWLDLVWAEQAISTETVMSWKMDPMTVGQETLRLTVRDVIERHGGDFWFERERARHQAFFRLTLSLANAQEQTLVDNFARPGSRPEYYDFDLFKTTELTHSMDERLLSELTYTVFDTETTGLNPSQGDEIIQIGAMRIVNQKLLKQECFEQLINPRRPIPLETVSIHGIGPQMVEGQPTIEEVLPAFHAFAQETVLVAHNAAFDMRFLQLKEDEADVRFNHPVLDTLLLSAVVHPHQDSHRLEDLAKRLNIPIVGRHTAMGDAHVTAEVFLRLIPLLAAKGIHTLGQAREAAQKTHYARLKY